MDIFNTLQLKLVEICERAHYEGLRHKGVSGDICEDALVEVLRKHLRGVNISRGIIKFAGKTKGRELTKDVLSTQIDIIVFKGRPLYESHNNVVVSIDQVVTIIEVKKWSFPKMFHSSSLLIRNVKKISSEINKYLGKKIPILLVTYRFHDRVEKNVNWFSIREKYPSPYTYCFFGNYSIKNGCILYPWEEEIWTQFSKSPYSGQLKKLITDLQKVIKDSE